MMNKKFIYILSGMVVGGCIGSVCSFLYLKKSFEEDEKKSLEAGMNAHLSKPLKIELVVATIEDLVK